MSEGYRHDWEDVTVVWKDNNEDNWQRDVSPFIQVLNSGLRTLILS
jgi:hypothetical protein